MPTILTLSEIVNCEGETGGVWVQDILVFGQVILLSVGIADLLASPAHVDTCRVEFE